MAFYLEAKREQLNNSDGCFIYFSVVEDVINPVRMELTAKIARPVVAVRMREHAAPSMENVFTPPDERYCISILHFIDSLFSFFIFCPPAYLLYRAKCAPILARMALGERRALNAVPVMDMEV